MNKEYAINTGETYEDGLDQLFIGEETDGFFELIPWNSDSLVNRRCSRGYPSISGWKLVKYPEQDVVDTLNKCEHQPVNVGFYSIKMVCKLCDKEL